MGSSGWDRSRAGVRASLLTLKSVPIAGSGISVRIPTVGEVLADEQAYYSAVSAMTATPYQYMVQLDDMGIDFSKRTDYELFLMLFPQICGQDLSLVFGGLRTDDYRVRYDGSNGTYVLSSEANGEGFQINEHVYLQVAGILREINGLERPRGRPGNEAARRYLLERERRRQRRRAGRPYEPFLERIVIALCNCSEFKYDYDGAMGLSLYRLIQSLRQVQARVAYDKTMIGVYAGTVDVSKLGDRSCLSWLRLEG